MLIADTREPDGMKSECDAVYDLKVQYGNGDYLIVVADEQGNKKQLLFERKTASDFMNTTYMDGRLNAQLDGVDALIFEKMFVPRRPAGWWIGLYTALNGVAHHHPVFFTLSSKHTIRQLRIIEKKLLHNEWGTMRKPIVLAPITAKENEEQVRVLCGFAGLGEKRANDILKYYKRLDLALQMVDRWAEDVKGVGPKTAEMAKRTMGREIV